MFDFLKKKDKWYMILPEGTEYIQVYEEVKYKDRVRIKRGFYEGLEGTLISCSQMFSYWYGVRMDDKKLWTLQFIRSEFEKIK